MDNQQLLETAQLWAHDVLAWVGFGTLTGLLAKAIMPGRDPGGAVATLAMGIGGTVIGCGVLSFFAPGAKITPISPGGFCLATAGAFSLLFFYKLLGGYYFHETEGPVRARGGMGRTRARGAGSTVVIEE